MLTYNSGADGHYLSKEDRKKLGIPIFHVSAKRPHKKENDKISK